MGFPARHNQAFKINAEEGPVGNNHDLRFRWNIFCYWTDQKIVESLSAWSIFYVPVVEHMRGVSLDLPINDLFCWQPMGLYAGRSNQPEVGFFICNPISEDDLFSPF